MVLGITCPPGPGKLSARGWMLTGSSGLFSMAGPCPSVTMAKPVVHPQGSMLARSNWRIPTRLLKPSFVFKRTLPWTRAGSRPRITPGSLVYQNKSYCETWRWLSEKALARWRGLWADGTSAGAGPGLRNCTQWSFQAPGRPDSPRKGLYGCLQPWGASWREPNLRSLPRILCPLW